MPRYSELWVCFEAEAEPPPHVLALSFLRADQEEAAELRWGDQFVSGRVLAQEVRKDARGQYLDLIARIGATPVAGRTLRQALQGSGGYSRWWFLKTSEKDCVWDDDVTYTTIIRLLCVKRVADQYSLKRVRLIGGSPQFAAALATAYEPVSREASRPSSVRSILEVMWIIAIGLLSRAAFLLFYLRLWWRLRRHPVDTHEQFDVLLEAHLDWSLEPDAGESVRDRYFTDLPGKLEAEGLKVGWLAWCEPDRHVRRRPLKDILAWAARYPSLVLLERSLTPSRIVGSACNLRYLADFLRFRRSHEFRALFLVEGFDLYPVLGKQLLRLVSGSSIPRLEVLADATERVCRAYHPKCLVTFLELFLHARALYTGARLGWPAVKLWTAQHAGYSSDKTFGAARLGTELQGRPDGCPLPAPDGIFVMGELAQRLWQENGFRADRVIMTGGLRYQQIRIESDRRPDRANRQAGILLIAGMNEALDLDMCAAVSSAARELPIGIRLRDHPQYRLSERMGFKPYRRRIDVTSGTVDEDLARADLVIFTHSGMAEEALLRGIPTWQWRWAGFNTSVFVDLEVIPAFTSVSALRNAVQTFLKEPQRYRPTGEVQQLVLRQCFGTDPARASERIRTEIMGLIGVKEMAGASC